MWPESEFSCSASLSNHILVLAEHIIRSFAVLLQMKPILSINSAFPPILKIMVEMVDPFRMAIEIVGIKKKKE